MNSRENRWLARFAAFTAFCTLCLIGLGGLVTSHGVGMAVPDWPTTYGYNMFAFPMSQWIGGVFYEHTHRLAASAVGLLTTVLAVWLWIKEHRRWLCWLGTIAFFAVVLQGVLGGLRVTLYKQELGIFHATLAQLFLLLISLIAFFLGERWKQLSTGGGNGQVHRFFRPVLFVATVLVLAQLALGATMRHQHAGLAVPDFPLAYGELWPKTDESFLAEVNSKRVDSRDFHPITTGQIYLHMAHRITALLIVVAVGACAWIASHGKNTPGLKNAAFVWLGLIAVQAGLGAFTVLSNKAADIATAHVVLGAISLVWGGLMFAGSTQCAVARVEESASAHNRVESPAVA